MWKLIRNNSITEEEQVRRGVYQKFDERLSEDFCCFTVGHNHVEEAVEGEESGYLRDDKQLFSRSFATKSRHT